MKPDIHPDYNEATVKCSCGNTYVTHTTKADLHVELCNECHPFFTGKQKLVDSGGRVERFQRRYGERKGKAKAAPPAGDARRTKSAPRRRRAGTRPATPPSLRPVLMFDDRMAALESEFHAVEADLADPAILSDSDRVRDLSRRHKELGEIVRAWRELSSSRADVAVAREMLTDASGDEREMMRQEVEEAEASVAELEERIQSLLQPKDPNVGRNVIMEIRGAVGGDEANLFARVLYDMYTRFAALEKWKVEILSEDASDRDGINEAVFLVKGPEAYIRLEHEAGTHRVQRVPVTEAKGRIHTSTATVTVLPEAAEVEIDIDPNDLKIDVYRSTGPGGQSVNTTDSAVRITHLPTGTVVAMQDEKSQIQNRAKAMVVLRARLLKAEQDRQAAAMSDARRSQVGAGGRTDKIRTYNYKENRVTDHRINLTLYKLDQVLAGDLTELTDALMADKRARQLAGEEEVGP